MSNVLDVMHTYTVARDTGDMDTMTQVIEDMLVDMFFEGEHVEVLAYEFEYTPECTPEFGDRVARRYATSSAQMIAQEIGV